MMKKHLFELLGDAVIFAFGALTLGLFILIAAFGQVLCFEDDWLILYIELIMAIVVIALGIERTIDDIKRVLKK